MTDDVSLFSESNSRFIVEVAPEKQEAFEKCMADISIGCIGVVVDERGISSSTAPMGARFVETTIDQTQGEVGRGRFRW